MTDEMMEFRQKFIVSFVAFISVLGIGTLGFWLLGHGQYTVFDALYMTVITASTVGYGEIHSLEHNHAARVFAIFIIFFGMGTIVYFVSNATAFFVEGDLKEIFRRKRMHKLIQNMKDHYIVCGAGTMGMHVVEEFYRTGRRVVSVDLDESRITDFSDKYPGMGLIVGDASENSTLEAAGIERAHGVVVATTSDKDNLVITLSARQLNPSLRIVSRCSDVKHIKKMRSAGADNVVSSNFIGGMRLASEMVRPHVTTFLDRMLRDKDLALRIEEVNIKADSPLVGRPIRDFRKTILVIALSQPDGEYLFNPKDDYRVQAGETVIFMGCPEDRENLMCSLT